MTERLDNQKPETRRAGFFKKTGATFAGALALAGGLVYPESSLSAAQDKKLALTAEASPTTRGTINFVNKKLLGVVDSLRKIDEESPEVNIYSTDDHGRQITVIDASFSDLSKNDTELTLQIKFLPGASLPYYAKYTKGPRESDKVAYSTYEREGGMVRITRQGAPDFSDKSAVGGGLNVTELNPNRQTRPIEVKINDQTSMLFISEIRSVSSLLSKKYK